jgi:hypothetical protein
VTLVPLQETSTPRLIDRARALSIVARHPRYAPTRPRGPTEPSFLLAAYATGLPQQYPKAG